MKFNTNLFFNPLKVIIGSAIGFTSFASISIAAPTSSAVNPCPGIYYEEPHNTMRVVPMGCPPNAATLLEAEQETVPAASLINQVIPTQAPLPENQQPILTTIVLNAGQVNIKMMNMTNTQMIYQVIGHTEQRTLMPKAEIMLRDLPAPVTVTFIRSDGGLTKVMPVESSEKGTLDLMMHEALGLNDSQNTVRVQSDGKVVAF
jgi:hypothetical protein